MPTQAPFTVTTTVSELSEGLVAGQSYIAQHVGGQLVEYVTAAADPANADVAWHLLKPYNFIIFDPANKVWVRTQQSSARLAISDA